MSDFMIRVLYVQGVSQIGGAERELLLWLGSLDRTIISPFVALSGGGPLGTELANLEVPFSRIPLPPWRKISYRPFVPFAVISLIRLMRKWDINLLHVNDYWWGPPSVLAAKFLKCPSLVHVRQEVEVSKISKYWLHKPTTVIPVSQHVAHSLQDGGVPPQSIHVLLSGIPETLLRDPPMQGGLRARMGLAPKTIVIGTVSNVFPRKGLDFLIRAFAHVKNTHSTSVLVIVGKGDSQYEATLRNLVARLALTESVLFVGFEPNPETCIVDFDIFVLSSVLEGFGIVLLEAMALGKPVVATRVGGIPEIVEHGRTGILVPPADEGEMSRALLTLIDDPQVRADMGMKGKSRVERHFLLDRMLDDLCQIYKKLSETSNDRE